MNSGFKYASRFAKNVAIGAVAGYASGRIVAPTYGASEAGKRGAEVGALVGGISAIPMAKAARAALSAGKVVMRGLEATPGSKVGALIKKARSASGGVWRRIRGRPVFIRSKG